MVHRILSALCSMRKPSVIARTANLVALYTVPPGAQTLKPPTEDMLMMWPCFCFCMIGSTAATPNRRPLMFTSIMRFGLGIAMLGTQTGGSLNPACQFGPAVVSGDTDRLWVFLLAPMVGAEVAARLLKTLQRRRQVLTHRLCGTEVSGEPLGERRMASARI